MVMLLVAPCSGQTKVADLQITRGIEKKIAGLQISVKDVCCVYELEPSQDLCQAQYRSVLTTADAAAHRPASRTLQTWYMKYW